MCAKPPWFFASALGTILAMLFVAAPALPLFMRFTLRNTRTETRQGASIR
jgi:hypothetical protein